MKLKRVDVLTGTRPAHLTVSIARHLSNTDTLMTVYEERTAFQEALRKSAGSQTIELPPACRASEPALEVVQNSERDGSRRIRTQSAEISFRLSGSKLISTFAGTGIDVLATPSMDAAAEHLTPGRMVAWFADVSGAAVAKELMDGWTQWILAHRASFSRIAILTTPGAFPLILSIVNYRHGMDELIRIHSDHAEWERAIAISAAG